MKRVSLYFKLSVVFFAAMSLTACSGVGESKKAQESDSSLTTEADSGYPESEGISTESELLTEMETEAAIETEESISEAMPEESEYLEESDELFVYTGPDTWSVPEVTVSTVPDDLLEAALNGNKAMFTYLGSQGINYDYYATDYTAGYGFLDCPAQLLEHDVYGAVRYSRNDESSDDAPMLFVIMPQEEEEYEDVKEDLVSYLSKQSSNTATRMIAAPIATDEDEETDTIYAVQEYMIDGKACYLIEGYRDNGVFYQFDGFGFDQDSNKRVDMIRYQGNCDKCLVLLSRDGLGYLSSESTVYDLDRNVRYEQSYQDLTDEMNNESMYMYNDEDFDLDAYPRDADNETDYCYVMFDDLDYSLMIADSEDALKKTARGLNIETQNLIRLAGRFEQIDGYKGSYYNLLNMAAVLIRRGETDTASRIVSYLEDQWEEENKKERLAAFGDTEYEGLYHNERYLSYLKDILDDEKECSYLNTIWQVRISVPYRFGERGVKYGSDEYKKEYQPLVDLLTELKGYKNTPLYLQELLKPFLKQMIEERNTDSADQIFALMEEYYPECGNYVVSEWEMKKYHTQIETIKEEEAYKAGKREELDKAEEGELFHFGSLDEKDLEWIILKKEEDKALLLLNGTFGTSAFGKQQEKASYKESAVSSMLEKRIYPKAFSNAEKQMILPFSLKKDGSYSFKEDGSHFHLLGTSEAKEYMPENEDRILKDPAGVPQTWWLRTAGSRDGFVRYINEEGTIMKGGTPSVKRMEVRPLIWIDRSEG